MIPLFAVFSAGLLNISAYNGITYRGESSLWNSFVVGTGVRVLTYMSSADEFINSIGIPWLQYKILDDSGKSLLLNSSATSPPCGTYYQVRMQSLSAKNISLYSAHQYEREHVYDHEFIEYVTSNEAGVLGSVGGNIASIEIPEIFSPLF